MIIRRLQKIRAKKAEKEFFKNSSTEEVFTHIYESNKWGDSESRSGKGSNLEKTANLMEAIPSMLKELNAESMLDIPCGDFHWMKEIELPLDRYMGADIVKPMIKENQRRFGNDRREFLHLDLIKDDLPSVDVIFCRECLVHLSFADISLALANIDRSGAKYLFTTQFPEIQKNKDSITGKHHSLNFTAAPFNWPKPMMSHNEYFSSKRRGNKHLSVWKISELTI
jgi:hypothetical protein